MNYGAILLTQDVIRNRISRMRSICNFTKVFFCCSVNLLLGKIFQFIFCPVARLFFEAEVNHINSAISSTLFSRVMGEINECSSGDNLVEALISGEDIRFKHHFGVDFIAIARAISRYIFMKKVEGASTIEQQLTRTITSDYRLSFKRKIKECILAFSICRAYNKRDIALCYILLAYYGYKMSGLIQATTSLGMNYKCLNLHDSALIVASMKYPVPKSTTALHRNKHEARVKHILKTASRINTHAGIYSTPSLRRPRN